MSLVQLIDANRNMLQREASRARQGRGLVFRTLVDGLAVQVRAGREHTTTDWNGIRGANCRGKGAVGLPCVLGSREPNLPAAPATYSSERK